MNFIFEAVIAMIEKSEFCTFLGERIGSLFITLLHSTTTIDANYAASFH